MTSDTYRRPLHFTASSLMQSVHPIEVNLVGVGGTGSHVLRGLADIHTALVALGQPGLLVNAFDENVVSSANLGRQRFATAEIGLPKAVAIINRINRFYGTYWKAMTHPYASPFLERLEEHLTAPLTISCVDIVGSRFDIEHILTSYKDKEPDYAHRSKPLYWMDFGNSRHTGQVVLSTLEQITQPSSRKYQPVSTLPLFTREYEAELKSVDEAREPSCSIAEALKKQDLFINSTLALLGCRLLWTMLTEGWIAHRGIFLNLADYKIGAIPITIPSSAIAA